MDIFDDDYQQKRHIFDFCRWINQKLGDLNKEPNFEELYFERLGGNVKKLLEEAIPVSRLGLYLYREWSDVFIQCFADNREYDAVIEVQDPSSKYVIKVEITTTQNDDSAMRRQALSRNGFVHFGGLIKREGRTIISEGEFVDVDEESKKLVQLALQRLELRLKNTYDERTAILVYVDAFRILAHDYRFRLIEQVKTLLRERNLALYGFFFCYGSNLGVDGIVNRPPYDF